MTAICIASAALVSFLPSVQAQVPEWPQFRGPGGSGVSADSELPVSFGPEENMLWKADVPFGASSPVLTKKAVVVTATTEEHLFVMAFDRKSGEKSWAQAIERDRTHEIYPANDGASPSPVSDGENVYAFFPEMGLISFDGDGEERWRHALGPFVNFYGMSSSPVLAGDTLILLCDQQSGSFIVAVDAATGKQRWRSERAGIIECWTTPILYPVDAPREVIVFGSYFLTSYSIESGKELWRMKGFGYTPVCSPTLAGDHLYVSVPNHAEAGVPDWATISGMADANGDGELVPDELAGPMAEHFGWADVNKDDVIDKAEWDDAYNGMNSKDYGLAAIDLSGEDGPVELWRFKKALPSIASPLLYEGVLYLARDGGLVTLIDAASGTMISRERLPDAMGECWASPVAAGGRVYVANNAGQVAVIEAGAEWKVLETNDLGDDCTATPAIGGNALFVRTRAALWAFADSAPQ